MVFLGNFWWVFLLLAVIGAMATIVLQIRAMNQSTDPFEFLAGGGGFFKKHIPAAIFGILTSAFFILFVIGVVVAWMA